MLLLFIVRVSVATVTCDLVTFEFTSPPWTDYANPFLFGWGTLYRNDGIGNHNPCGSTALVNPTDGQSPSEYAAVCSHSCAKDSFCDHLHKPVGFPGSGKCSGLIAGFCYLECSADADCPFYSHCESPQYEMAPNADYFGAAWGHTKMCLWGGETNPFGDSTYHNIQTAGGVEITSTVLQYPAKAQVYTTELKAGNGVLIGAGYEPAMDTSGSGQGGYVKFKDLPNIAGATSIEFSVTFAGLQTVTNTPLLECSEDGAHMLSVSVTSAQKLAWSVTNSDTSTVYTTDPITSKSYHLIFTVDGSTMLLYANGVQNASLASSQSPAAVARTDCFIGCHLNCGAHQGAVAIVAFFKIYSGVLSAAEATMRYQQHLSREKRDELTKLVPAPAPVKCPSNACGLWRLLFGLFAGGIAVFGGAVLIAIVIIVIVRRHGSKKGLVAPSPSSPVGVTVEAEPIAFRHRERVRARVNRRLHIQRSD